MELDGVFREAERRGDVVVGEAVAQELKNLSLSRCECVGQVIRGTVRR